MSVIGENAEIVPNRPPDEGVECPPARSRNAESEGLAVLRAPDGRFLPGTIGGPGRFPQGRKASIECLDRMLAKAENVEKLAVDLQREFDAGPARFFWKLVRHLASKHAINIEPGAAVAIKIIANVAEGQL